MVPRGPPGWPAERTVSRSQPVAAHLEIARRIGGIYTLDWLRAQRTTMGPTGNALDCVPSAKSSRHRRWQWKSHFGASSEALHSFEGARLVANCWGSVAVGWMWPTISRPMDSIFQPSPHRRPYASVGGRAAAARSSSSLAHKGPR